MIEEQLYRPVADFIGREFNCFHHGFKVGTKHGSIDVVGLRHVMSDYGGSTEVVAVEVKPEGATFLKSLGQAYAYSVMADRCYLAMHRRYRRAITQEEQNIAARLGVGLIVIGARRACRLVATSPEQKPMRAQRLALIGKLGFVERVLCGTVFPEKGMRSQRERSSIVNAIDEEKAFRFWLYSLSKQRGGAARKYIYDRRHMCPDCVQAFGGLRR